MAPKETDVTNYNMQPKKVIYSDVKVTPQPLPAHPMLKGKLNPCSSDYCSSNAQREVKGCCIPLFSAQPYSLYIRILKI